MKFHSKLFLNNRQIFDYCNKGIVQCTIPYFLYVCPKTLLQTNPTILSSPRKKNNAAESFSFKAKAKAFRGQINECGKYSKARLTMLRNSNFRPVFRNTLLLTTPTSVLYSVTRSSTNAHKPNTDSYKFIHKSSTPLTAGKTNRKKKLLYTQQNQVINHD